MTHELIFEILADITIGLAFPLFYASVFNLRIKKWQYILPMMIIFSVLGPILFVLNTPQIVVFVTGICINFTSILLFSKDAILKKIFYLLIPYFSDMLLSFGYISLRSILMPGWESNFGSLKYNDTAEFIILMLQSVLSLFVISKIIQRKKPKINDLTVIFLVTMMIVQIFFVTVAMYIYYTDVSIYYFFTVLGIYMFISVTLTLAVVYISIRISRRQNKQELIVRQYYFLNTQYEQLRNSYISYKKLRHDLKEHINVINGLAIQGKSDELKDYISTLNESWETLSSKTFCDVPAVDVVIADKYNVASAAGMKLDFAVGGIKETNADSVYMCSIISNLLNNAMEAAALCSEPYITLHSGIVMNNLVITCRNSISDIKIEKENPENHGYGLKIIKDFAAQLNGNFVYNKDGNAFNAVVTIPVINGGK